MRNTQARPRPSASARKARFLTGSIPRHVILMTLMGAVGLMSMFAVDLADLWFISLLGRVETTAGIGFAGTVSFANLSLGLGLGIAAGALAAINIGRHRRIRGRKYVTSALAVAMGLGGLITVLVEIFAHGILHGLGATGAAEQQAAIYLRIVALGFPLLAGAIIFSFALRACGDPRRAMYVTLIAAVTNAILDPVYIFGLDMGIAGAACATITANVLSFFIGWHGLGRVHGMLGRPSRAQLKRDGKGIAQIAIPASLTQLATPFLFAYIMYASARFGDEVVAASTIVNRIVPVAFGVVFSLSGAVGPIIGQNFGARNFHRVREAYLSGIALAVSYTLIMSVALFVLRNRLPEWFSATGIAASLVVYYCTWLAWSWIFTGGQFVAQAAFNNLGKARMSTLFNWGRATLGTILPVEILARMMGARGLFLGAALGSAIIGTLAVLYGWLLIHRLAQNKGEGHGAS